MFLRRRSLLEERMGCRRVFLSRVLPLKMSRCLANAVHPAVILLCISLSWFLSLALYLCPSYIAFNVLDLSVVGIILVSRCLPSPLSSTSSYSDPDCHFHQLIHVAFVVVHVVY